MIQIQMQKYKILIYLSIKSNNKKRFVVLAIKMKQIAAGICCRCGLFLSLAPTKVVFTGCKYYICLFEGRSGEVAFPANIYIE